MGISLNPSEAIDPLVDEGMEQIAAYLTQAAGADLHSVSTQENIRGLFIIARGEKVKRLQLLDMDTAALETTLPETSVLSLEQLMDLDLPEPEPIIDGVFNAGETVLLAGRPKVGKSRLTQQMALCLANGEPFLGMAVPRPVRVLMIDLENRPANMKKRFGKMATTERDSNGAPRLFIWSAPSLSAVTPDASPAGIAKLKQYVEETRPNVLIIDPLRLWLGGDENEATAIVKGLKTLDTIRQTLPDLAIVIVHHLRKEKSDSPQRLLQNPSLWTDAVSGHHALTSHVDACFGLERQPDEHGDSIIVFGGIARNAEPRTLLLEDDDSLRFNVVTSEPTARMLMTPVEGNIWDAAKKLGRFRHGELLTAANTKNKKAVTKALRIAMSNGLLDQEGDYYTVRPA